MTTSTAHITSRTKRMLEYIQARKLVARADLREELKVPGDKITALLRNAVSKGLIAVEQVAGSRGQYYRWLGGKAPAPKKTGPCLGGCGTLIVRDGRRFMCATCRARSHGMSPYAIG